MVTNAITYVLELHNNTALLTGHLRRCMHCSVVHYQSPISNTAVPNFFFTVMHLTITTKVYKSAYKTDFTWHTYNAYSVGHMKKCVHVRIT